MTIFENVSRGIPVSATACHSLTSWRNRNSDNPLARYVIAEVSFLGVAILGALETLASGVCFLALKAITCVIPKKIFNKVHTYQTYMYASRSMTTAITAFICSVYFNITLDQLNNNILVRITSPKNS